MRSETSATVHPRLVWGGLVVALTGVGLLGWGVIVLAWAPVALGTGVLLCGVGLALRGGVLNDADTSTAARAARTEVAHTAAGQEYAGITPGDRVRAEGARRTAAAASRRTRRLLAARPSAPPPLAPLAGGTLLLVMVVIVVAHGTLSIPSTTAHASGLRDAGLGIVSGVCGLWIGLLPGRHPWVAGVASLDGALMLLGAGLADHTELALAVVEAACGVATVAAALVAWASPTPKPPLFPPTDSDADGLGSGQSSTRTGSPGRPY